MSETEREQIVNSLWEKVVVEVIHGISPTNPHLVHAVMHEADLHRGVIRAAIERGTAACQAGKSHASNPYDVQGLSVFGTAVQAAWSSGFLDVERKNA